MKICIVTPQYGNHWTGAGNYATQLVKGLANNGHEVAVVCIRNHSQKDDNIRAIQTRGPSINPTLSKWIVSAWLFASTLNRVVKTESFDIIHFTDARDSFFFRHDLIPVLGTMHDYYFMEAQATPRYYRKVYKDWLSRWGFYVFTKVFERHALRRLRYVISNSEYVERALGRCYGIDSTSIKTVYIGVERGPEPPVCAFPAPAAHPRILFVGSNFQRKGLPTLLDAMPSLVDKYPGISLDVIGSDKNACALIGQCRRLAIEKSVNFHGSLDPNTTREFFRRADLFVMPSLIEGFGLVFLEAMCAGIPVIGGDVGGTRELITNNVNGVLVEPNNAALLAEKVTGILADDRFRAQLVEMGLKTVAEFSVEKMVLGTEAVYRNLIR